MPIEVQPLYQPYFLYYRFAGRIIPEDLDLLQCDEDSLFAAIHPEQSLGVIADVSALETISTRLFSQLQKMRLLTDDRVCMVVVVGANPYLRALAVSLGTMTGRRDYIFRNSVDLALHALRLHPRLASGTNHQSTGNRT